jgi:hypothetical protein
LKEDYFTHGRVASEKHRLIFAVEAGYKPKATINMECIIACSTDVSRPFKKEEKR